MAARKPSELTAITAPAATDVWIVENAAGSVLKATTLYKNVLPTYTVATVPSAVTYARSMIYVSDETGGATPAFSDGTNWRRTSDRAVVS